MPDSNRAVFSIACAVLGIWAAGCGSSSDDSSEGAPCSATDPCGSGDVCDFTAPGGAVCIARGGDLDGDGLTNDKDFCSRVAGGAFDEDGDKIGDECDACPISAPPSAPDPDGDAVDAPCDPDPRTAGDKIVVWNGFNAALPGDWLREPSAGAWQVTGGELVMTPTSTTAVEQVTVPLPQLSRSMAILSGFRIAAISSGAVQADAGVIALNRLPMGDTNSRCGSSRNIDGDEVKVEFSATVNTKPTQDLFATANRYRVVQQTEGATTNCVLVGGTPAAALQINNNGDLLARTGLYARNATVAFGYLLVVQRQ